MPFWSRESVGNRSSLIPISRVFWSLYWAKFWSWWHNLHETGTEELKSIRKKLEVITVFYQYLTVSGRSYAPKTPGKFPTLNKRYCNGWVFSRMELWIVTLTTWLHCPQWCFQGFWLGLIKLPSPPVLHPLPPPASWSITPIRKCLASLVSNPPWLLTIEGQQV